MRHFDVQLIGGMVLHDGKIAEMKTGEGKTLVATLPLYLNALAGKGAHAGHCQRLPGAAAMPVGWGRCSRPGPDGRGHRLGEGDVIRLRPRVPTRARRRALAPPAAGTRREAYAADITYGTNNEFGFDYLRDNMAAISTQCVQRDLHYAIVDEVDSILIDEARTPLIISGQAERDHRTNVLPVRSVDSAPRAKRDRYTIDEKAQGRH